MSAPLTDKLISQRSPDEDAALWARFRGALGRSVEADTGRWLKLMTGPVPDFDWSAFVHPSPTTQTRGEALANGIWRHGLERYEAGPNALPWLFEGASHHFRDRIHRFDWLPDLAAEGGPAVETARWLVDAWIEEFGNFDGFAWRAGPTADRVWNWMRCGSLLFDDPLESAVKLRLQALRRQVMHLDDLSTTTDDIDARLRIGAVLTVLGVISDQQDQVHIGLERLEGECTAQILPDGGHVGRSPSRVLRVMLDLVAVQDVLAKLNHPVPDFITKWVPRMGAMLNFFRCDDGGLLPFNDSSEGEPAQVEAALARLDTRPRRFTFSPKSGFQKLERGGLRLILDVGAAPERPFGDMAHAGALGFELADNASRLVTSCGFSRDVDLDWQAAVRRTGAHSTLVLGGRDNAGFVKHDATDLLMPVGPEGISAKRLEEEDEIWLDAQHSGYRDVFGLLHRRRLFMAGDGSRLAGEDSLVRPVSKEPSPDARPIGFEVRFHLHPNVSAEMGRTSIRLETESGAQWLFKTSHAGTRLEKSLYLARGSVEHPHQIVITGRADPNGDGQGPPNCVRWAFVREAVA
ncbi:MAG: heparinase II/III family protein [Pseudomonadota bacterium]